MEVFRLNYTAKGKERKKTTHVRVNNHLKESIQRVDSLSNDKIKNKYIQKAFDPTDE